jgi:hypothetical protein
MRSNLSKKLRYQKIRNYLIWIAAICLLLRLILIIVGVMADWPILMALAVFILSPILVVTSLIGTYYWSLAKARSGALVVLGLFGLIGWFIMAMLSDKWVYSEPKPASNYYFNAYQNNSEKD